MRRRKRRKRKRKRRRSRRSRSRRGSGNFEMRETLIKCEYEFLVRGVLKNFPSSIKI